ncbi:Bug family tripartite tricarboxylate transporter substrate binding protein [Cupriavidus sp. CuC1]|uniref:Bug family tripartite tricarboxylate transporter substrate binding protein n=1 Tax=Cupriavidus sp. CuC1 TaxID=3373131 RepID=UPI0037D334A5
MQTPRARLRALCAVSLLGLCAQAFAAYPDKPVRVNVGAPPGGGTDVVARLFADKMSGPMGQPMLVDNRPGAANTIAADLTAKAPADGYTLLAATNSPQVIAPQLMRLNFDPLKDLTPIGLALVVPHVLLVAPQVNVDSVASLVAQIKAQPGKFSYASSGIGSVQHMAAELFMKATGTQMVHVPYKGSSQAHVDLMAGQVQIMLDTSSSAMPHIRSGRLRALAVTTPKRASALPDVPTLQELGIKGADMSTWYAFYAPRQTPAPALERLTREFNAALQLPEVQGKLRGLGGDPGTLSREQFIQLQRADYDRFGKLIRDQNIKMD